MSDKILENLKMYEYKGTVFNVVDGDTVDINIDLGFKMSTTQRIRLADIDTPERGQPGYFEAKDRLKELVLDQLVLIRTTKVSKWGYYVGDLFIIKDCNRNVSRILLYENLAKPYSGGTKST